MQVLVPCGAPGGRERKISVSVTVSGRKDAQHTVTWRQRVDMPLQVDGKPAGLPPGHVNLYKYPKVYFEHLRKGKGVVPEPGALYVLEKLLLALLLDTDLCSDGSCFAHRLDGSGARPQHGLLVANTPASISLVLDAFHSRPSLIPLRHVGQPFLGENALHVLAVNKREPELCEIIELAARSLDAEQLKEMYLAHALGVFFHADPMDFYGASPLGYLVAFSLEKALVTLLAVSSSSPAMAGLVDLNDPTHACPLTGFLPLHVAVANSLTSMFNFLIDLPGLPIEFDSMRAKTNALSQCASTHARPSSRQACPGAPAQQRARHLGAQLASRRLGAPLI